MKERQQQVRAFPQAVKSTVTYYCICSTEVGVVFRICCLIFPWQYSSGFNSGAEGGSHSVITSRSVASYSLTMRNRWIEERLQITINGCLMWAPR
jgi:hypothetical protein